MTRLEAALSGIVSALDGLGTRAALIGGLAVSVRSEPRFTRDLDLAVAIPDDRHAEALVHALSSLGYVAVATVEQTSTHRLATVRPRPASEPHRAGVVVDLLFASSGIEPEIVADAEPLEVFPGLVVPVARVGHLVALKLLARNDVTRPQDASDLEALRPELDDLELNRARQAVGQIENRGFARGRDLQAALEVMIQARR